MRNQREDHLECLKAETPTFIKVMRAVPGDQASYRPHPRSSSAADIVWLLAVELRDAITIIERGEVDFSFTPAPGIAESVAAYEKHAHALEQRLATLDDAAWDGKARLKMDGKMVWETTLGDMLFGFLFDAVHHRGQLSSYLRPMGAKVPSITARRATIREDHRPSGSLPKEPQSRTGPRRVRNRRSGTRLPAIEFSVR